VLEVLYHHVTFDGARISLATGTVKNVEFFVCLSVCLSVMLLNVRVCAPDFAIKSLEHRNNFMYVCMYVCILRARVQPTLDPYAEAFL